MLKHYHAVSVTTGSPTFTYNNITYYPATLFTVPSGKELALITLRINGGENGGEINIATMVNDNISSLMTFSVRANDVIYIDSKEFYEAGEKLCIFASQEGISVDAYAHLSDIS